MVWGCMGWNGAGIISEVEGKMDAKQYINILEGGLLESAQKLEISEGDLIFQQDNDPKHTSKHAQKWFEDQGITLLDWPAQSPDLNSIEHLWNLLKHKVWHMKYWHRVSGNYGKEQQLNGTISLLKSVRDL